MLKHKACNIYIWDILRISCNSPNVHTCKTKRKKIQCVANTADLTSNFLHSAGNTSKCLTTLFRLRRMFNLKVGIPLQCTIYLLRA